MISFIGYYNYTVILTYISLFCSIAGMLFTVNGWYKMAVLCLALSGLCDMFDGKIARRKTDRTDDEKCFGIQIDSLCDMVCFAKMQMRKKNCQNPRKKPKRLHNAKQIEP